MLLTRIFTRTLVRSARFSAKESDQIPEKNQDPDDLHRYLWLKCQSHEVGVLDSYEKFVKSAAQHLDINYVKTEEPWRIIKRRTMLASRFVHKKYRVQYETRTYFRNMLFKNITGSTAETFLEYVERNLPDGTLLIVEKHTLAELPFDQ